jgi:hypothetical protein
VDVILMPPDDGDMSDEDSDDEEDILPKDQNHLGRGILSQQAEVVLYNDEDVLPDIIDPVDEGEPEAARMSRKRARTDQEEEEENEEMEEMEEIEVMEEDTMNKRGRNLSRTKNTDRRWKSSKPNIFGMSVPEFYEQPLKTLPDGCDTPYDFFKLFVTDEFVDQTVEASQLYAGRKGRVQIQPKLTHNNIRISHAIMYMTGYITPSNRRMYWEKREDSRNSLVAKTMSEANFTNILRNTTFVKTTEADPKDRFWKVRPLFDQINSCAKQWIKHPEKVSIDEAMVKYFGPHPLKQFMRGKPHRFGYKVSFQKFI